MGADEGSSPLGKASRAYRPLASDRASHSAPHTKRWLTHRHRAGAHTHMGSSPSTHTVTQGTLDSVKIQEIFDECTTARDDLQRNGWFSP